MILCDVYFPCHQTYAVLDLFSVFKQKPATASRLHVFLQLVTNTNMWLKDAAPRNRRRGRFLQISWRGQELCVTWQKLCKFSPVFSDSLDIIHVSQELQEFSLVNVLIYDMFPYISPPRWPWRLPKRSRSRIRWDLEGMGCLWGDVLSCRFVDYVPSRCRIGRISNTHGTRESWCLAHVEAVESCGRWCRYRRTIATSSANIWRSQKIMHLFWWMVLLR